MILLLVVAVAGFAAFEVITHKYRKIAEQYDLADMEKMESASIIYDRTGKQIGKIFIQNRHPVPFSEFPRQLVEAVIAEEDNRFYEHKGVDYMGIMRAAIANWRRGKVTQGASTVTQQIARNSFELRERTYKRKLIELFLAERIEKSLSKEKIMELYLNRVYFGSGLYGAEAAARGYFGKSAKDLNVGECAMLAGLLKSPNALSPWNNFPGALEARNFVLGRMKDNGFLSRSQYKDALAELLIVRKRADPFKVSYAIDHVRQQAIAALGFDRAMNGGYQIFTTLDATMQRTAEVALKQKLSEIEKLPGYPHPLFETYQQEFRNAEKSTRSGTAVNLPPPTYLQGAVFALENRTGGILALVGGRDFTHNEFNRTMQAKFPVGTAFTPLVYAAAFEKGFFPGTIVQDAALDNRYVMVGGETGILGEWGVERADNDYEGGIPMRDALVKGKNAATVRVGLQTGLEAVKSLSAKAGIDAPLRDFSNTFLGSSEVTLDSMALAYTMFPNGGWRPKQIYIIQKIADAKGNVIFEANPEKQPVISEGVAYEMHSVLSDALKSGTGAIAYSSYGLKDFPAGGKTGAAYNFTDAYFIGYNAPVTCAVWVGFDKPTKIYRGAFGKDLALPVWTAVMNSSLEDFSAEEIAKPEAIREVEVSKVTGLMANSPASKAAARSLGLKDDPSKNYKELATEAQIQSLNKMASAAFDKQYDQEEWPRAAAAVDLTTIRPVAVLTPPLIGFDDAYNSMRPMMQQFDGDNIPVMKAVRATDGKEAESPEEALATAQAAAAANGTIPQATMSNEVRRAEAVKPLDSPLDTPVIQVKPPEPIKF